MHDKKGRLIEKGDYVKVPDPFQEKYPPDSAKQTIGLVAATYGDDQNGTCNLGLHFFDVRKGQSSSNAKDSEIVLKHDGSDPTPAE
jgi:hypothetical protein